MTIKTKFNPGNIVFHLWNNKVHSSKIKRLALNGQHSLVKGFVTWEFEETYLAGKEIPYTMYPTSEEELFATKEELLKSL